MKIRRKTHQRSTHAITHSTHHRPSDTEHPELKKYKKHTRHTRVVLLLAYFVAGAGIMVAVWGIITAVNYSNSLSSNRINQPELVGVVLPLPSNHVSNIKDVTWKGGAKEAPMKGLAAKNVSLTISASATGVSRYYTSNEKISGDFDYIVDWSIGTWCQTQTCEIPVGVVTTDGSQDERILIGLTNSPMMAFTTQHYINGSVQPATYAETKSPNGSVLLARRGNQIITYYVKDGTYTYLAKQAVSGECCKLLFGVRNESTTGPLAVTFTKVEVRQ